MKKILTRKDILKIILFVFLFSFSLFAQQLQVHFIDVGQGDAILIIFPNNKTVLIDAGDKIANKIISEYLIKNNIKNLDIVIETHADNDHIGGMEKIVESFPIALYLDSGLRKSTDTCRNLHNVIEKKKIPNILARTGQKYEFDDATLEILFPSEPLITSPITKQWNNNSVVTKLVYKNVSFLFTGDIEKEAESRILKELPSEELKSDILKVAHHGSRDSTTEEFLKLVNPKIAVISVGKGNKYKHPHNETIKRLIEKGIAIYRTDYHGNILIKTDGKTYEVIIQKKQKELSNQETRAPPILETTILLAEEKTVSETINYVGSKNSNKVHLPSCQFTKNIKSENLIIFKTLEDAYKKGYSPCKVCKPDEKTFQQKQFSDLDETVYITKTGSKYHREYCSYLKKSKIPIKKKEAINKGYTPCGRCNPQ